MKKLMTILFAVIAIALTAQAKLVQPVKWAGAIEGDSIHLTATIEDGWHLNIIELGDGVKTLTKQGGQIALGDYEEGMAGA